MAAPHVAGLAALLFQQHPEWSRTQVVNRIEGTAHPLSGAGSGLIDVQKALGVRTTTPKPSPTATRTSSPKPRPKPSPTATTHTVATPSPVKVTPTPVVTTPPPTPSPTPSAVETSAPPVLAEPPVTDSADDIPVPVAGIAGGLIGLVGLGVLLQSLRR
jgi:hypothetical protein